jgi:hypothetical protein
MDPSSNKLGSSMRGRGKFCSSAFHRSPELCHWGLHERLVKEKNCSASNFWVQKLEAEQRYFISSSFENWAPKLRASKRAKISSNFFPECNSWFLFYFICLISLFWRALSISKVHLQRYVWLFFFSHYVFKLCILFSFSFHYLL